VNPQASDTIELANLARTIARGWRTVVGFTVLGIALAAAFIAVAPRKYTGTSSVILKPDAQGGAASSVIAQVTGLNDVTGGLLGGKNSLDTEIGVLGSRAVVGQAVDSLKLQARMLRRSPVPTHDMLAALDAPGSFRRQKYHFERSAGGSAYRFTGKDAAGEMVPGRPVALPAGSLTFAEKANLPEEFDLELRDREDAIDRVKANLEVGKGKGEVANIEYAGDDSLTAARLPNLLLGIYLDRRKTIDRGVNQRRLEFLTAKSDSMDRQLNQASRELREQQEASGVLDATAVARVGLENDALLRSRLTDVVVEQSALRQLMSQIAAKTATPRQLAAYPTFLKSPAVNSLVVQLADLETKRTALLGNRMETDREVVALTNSIRDVEAQLVPFAQTYASSLESQRGDIEASLKGVENSLARLPKAAESSNRLQRDVLDLARLSAGLQAQIVEAKLAAIGEGGEVRPLDAAVPPKGPSSPNKPIVAGLGTVGGLFVGMIAALVFGSLGRWVRDPVDLERTTGVPSLQFDPGVPLLLSNGGSRTIVVAPVVAGVEVTAVVNRLMQTAVSRSLSPVLLNLPDAAADVNATIGRLESEHDLVVVQLPSLVTDSAVATLQHGRPVLLVTPGGRAERRHVVNAVGMLRRLEVPCAGIVMNVAERRSIRAGRT
jgi:tyrosine-protein kinase Etk/Wzc